MEGGSASTSIMYGDGNNYVGPPYEFISSVTNLARLPRFGHGRDVTLLVSSDAAAQSDYAAGLISLFVFLLIIFLFWTFAILTFKVMGNQNAGFLSGHHFVVPDPVDDESGGKRGTRPRRVRIVFLVATAFLMAFTFVFVAMGLTNVNNASATVDNSLETTMELVKNAETIARNIERVGTKSIEIRDAAVTELDDICPADPNIAITVGMDITGIATSAQRDLTMLANFIGDGLATLDETLGSVKGFTKSAQETTRELEFWGWQMKLLAAGLFVLPSFLAVGVGLIMLDVDNKPYQMALTYFFMPLFGVTIVCCFVVCCLMLPASATAADACSGGGMVRGGPDDTVLTVYRNLRGDDDGLLIFQFVAFYTQRCDREYYPFGFLGEYLDQLDEAMESTEYASSALGDNQGLLESQCGRNFDGVLEIVDEMHDNLVLLRRQVDYSLDLVKCENINSLYVNTVHEAGCTYSVDALAWIFASSLVVSVCGLIMIMLRAAYYPTEHLELSDTWSTKSPSPSKTMESASPSRKGASRDSEEGTASDISRGRRAVGSAAPAPPKPEVVAPAREETPPMVIPQSIKVEQVHEDEFEIGHLVKEF